MHFDELLGDAEPESGPTEFPGDGGVHLLELREDVFDLVLWNTDPRIRDTIAEPRARSLAPNLTPPLSGEFQRVPRKGHEALRDPLAVPVSQRNVLLGGGVELQPFFQGEIGRASCRERG